MFWLKWALFANFEAKRAENGFKKRAGFFYERVKEFDFAPISIQALSTFSKTLKSFYPNLQNALDVHKQTI